MKESELTDTGEQRDKSLEKAKPYEPPKLFRVSLRPEEAVLGHCKISGSAGPVSSSCGGALHCRTFGS